MDRFDAAGEPDQDGGRVRDDGVEVGAIVGAAAAASAYAGADTAAAIVSSDTSLKTDIYSAWELRMVTKREVRMVTARRSVSRRVTSVVRATIMQDAPGLDSSTFTRRYGTQGS